MGLVEKLFDSLSVHLFVRVIKFFWLKILTVFMCAQCIHNNNNLYYIQIPSYGNIKQVSYY